MNHRRRPFFPSTRDDWEDIAWSVLFGAFPLIALGWIFARFNQGTM